jgi:hypothetical protein
MDCVNYDSTVTCCVCSTVVALKDVKFPICADAYECTACTQKK